MNDQETSETTATQSSEEPDTKIRIDLGTEDEVDKRMREAQERVEAQRAVENPETFTWEVWKVREARAADDEGRAGMIENVGELVNVETAYRPWPWNGEREGLAMVARLGQGAGDYWLVCGDRVQRVSIVAETVYRLAGEES